MDTKQHDPPISSRGTREQMPGFLGRCDDRYGIMWRIANSIRRFSVIRSARFLKGCVRPPNYLRPVLIIGMPRSGTTFLFHLLRESNQLGSLPREGHDIWRMFHHPRYCGWESDFVEQGQVRLGERRLVNAFLYSYFDSKRFVDKTADNCVRTPYLLELFPDAIILVMKRNPCDVINSYINMWRHPKGRFRSYFVPTDLQIPNYPHRRMWCSTLIKGWRNLTTTPIPEIAFAQWSQYVEAIVAARKLVPEQQWMEVHFEDLLDRTDETLNSIYRKIQISNEPPLEKKLEELLSNPAMALSPPGNNKWRSHNCDEVRSLLPRIASSSEKLGYQIDSTSGAATYVGTLQE